jgi:hypothetical protein
MQVDMFAYHDALGGTILAFLVATASINPKYALKKVDTIESLTMKAL